VLDPLRGYIMALEAVLSGSNFDALNFGPDSRSLTVRDVADLSQKTWLSSTSVEFSDNVLKDPAEAISLHLDASRATDSLGGQPSGMRVNRLLPQSNGGMVS